MKGPADSQQINAVRRCNGVAATCTTPFIIPAEGLNGAWWAVIPYEVLTLVPGAWLTDAYGSSFYQHGANRLVLEPDLFIDGFGVLTGGLVPFIVNQ